MTLLNGTRSATAVASAKLPDDLALEEFVGLVQALNTLASPRDFAINPPRPVPIFKAQYGSDFLVIIGIASGVAGVLVSAAKALDLIAAAALKNEERLGKRAERIAKSRDRADLSKGDEDLLSRRERDQLERVFDGDGERVTPEVVRAFAVLSDYGVRIRIRDE